MPVNWKVNMENDEMEVHESLIRNIWIPLVTLVFNGDGLLAMQVPPPSLPPPPPGGSGLPTGAGATLVGLLATMVLVLTTHCFPYFLQRDIQQIIQIQCLNTSELESSNFKSKFTVF